MSKQVIRESLFPRKILKEAIRESLFPQKFYFFTWLANKGWEDRIVILNYNLFKIEEEFITVRESLFPRKISKRAIRESLFSRKISIGAIRESLFPKFRDFFSSWKFLPQKFFPLSNKIFTPSKCEGNHNIIWVIQIYVCQHFPKVTYDIIRDHVQISSKFVLKKIVPYVAFEQVILVFRPEWVVQSQHMERFF